MPRSSSILGESITYFQDLFPGSKVQTSLFASLIYLYWKELQKVVLDMVTLKDVLVHPPESIFSFLFFLVVAVCLEPCQLLR